MNRLTVDNLPDFLTTEDIAEVLRQDVEQARHVTRKHKDVLHPFKQGRRTLVPREKFELYLSLLQAGKIS